MRATDFRSIARVNGVPTDSRFRDTLRVYGYSGMVDQVTVRIFDPALPQPLVEIHFTLQATNDPQRFPSYLQIDPLSYSQVAPPDRVRIEVESASTPPKPIWAFVSVTNNETQHVTVIAPSP